MLPFDQISFLSDLVSEQMVPLVPPGGANGMVANDVEMIGYVPALHRALPSEARTRLEADTASSVGRLSTSNESVWRERVSQALLALDCISDRQLQMSAAVDLMTATLLRNPLALTSPDLMAFRWAVKTVIARSPDLTPQQLTNHADRMSRLVQQPRGMVDPSQRKYVLEACLAAVRLCADPKAFAACLVPALVHEVEPYVPQSIQFLAAAVALADHANVPVGIALHKYLDKLEEEDIQRLGEGNLITLAVLSFHVDSGTGSYYLAHEHDLPARTGPDRTTRIDHPAWLLNMREILSQVWAERSAGEDAQEQALIWDAIGTAMPNSLSPTARDDYALCGPFQQLAQGLIQPAVGPRVRVADWPDLQQRLYEELNG